MKSMVFTKKTVRFLAMISAVGILVTANTPMVYAADLEQMVSAVAQEQSEVPAAEATAEEVVTEDTAEPVVEEVVEAVPEEPVIVKLTASQRKANEAGPDTAIIGKSFEVPNVNSYMKTYMSYKAITMKSSLQYKLQQTATTDEFGFRRDPNGYYMVALGTYYTGNSCGKYFRITLKDGTVFDCVTGDVKANRHTDKKNQHRNGNIVEFIVDTKQIPRACIVSGSMGNANGYRFAARVEKIEELL